MSDFEIETTQHAVGQGGFLVGQICTNASTFRWAYDCGSNQLDPLNSAIGDVAQSGPIDCLFLSHLDKDHVVGIDRLLTTAGVTEVVLPYLNDREKLFLISTELMSGALSSDFLNVISDPVQWFTSRGVTQITFVETGDAPPDLPPDTVPPSPDSPTGDPIDDMIKTRWTGKTRPEGASNAQIASSDGVLNVASRAGYLGWIFIPQVHEPPVDKMEKFKEGIEKEFGSSNTLQVVIDDVKKSSGREKLRKIYERLWKHHNLISMSLYSGPHPQIGPDKVMYWSTPWHTKSILFRHPGEIGWLSTGDANLSVKSRRDSFLKHYQAVSGFVGTFVLPHHGSSHNFHADIITSFPHIEFAIAAAGPNAHGHPSPKVKGFIKLVARKRFIQVSDDLDTTFATRVRIGRR